MFIIWIHKPIGWTPKRCVEEYKKIIGEQGKVAGPQDPMVFRLLPLIVNGKHSMAL